LAEAKAILKKAGNPIATSHNNVFHFSGFVFLKVLMVVTFSVGLASLKTLRKPRR
jgi:hypothetical protein